jgi:hypothetical protein
MRTTNYSSVNFYNNIKDDRNSHIPFTLTILISTDLCDYIYENVTIIYSFKKFEVSNISTSK